MLRVAISRITLAPVVVWGETQRAQRYIQVLVQSDYGLELRLVNAFLWANHAETLFLFLVLRDGLLDGSVVLLVAGEDVGDKGTLTG